MTDREARALRGFLLAGGTLEQWNRVAVKPSVPVRPSPNGRVIDPAPDWKFKQGGRYYGTKQLVLSAVVPDPTLKAPWED